MFRVQHRSVFNSFLNAPQRLECRRGNKPCTDQQVEYPGELLYFFVDARLFPPLVVDVMPRQISFMGMHSAMSLFAYEYAKQNDVRSAANQMTRATPTAREHERMLSLDILVADEKLRLQRFIETPAQMRKKLQDELAKLYRSTCTTSGCRVHNQKACSTMGRGHSVAMTASRFPPNKSPLVELAAAITDRMTAS